MKRPRALGKRYGRGRGSRRLKFAMAPPRDPSTREVIPRTPEDQAAFYGVREERAYESWMRTGSQPGLMNSMTAAEHAQAASKSESRAVEDEHDALRHDGLGNAQAAHRARVNAALERAIARAHRELMGRKLLMPVGGA